MLRSRDTTKNAQQQTNIQIDETSTSSTFTKYGILICLLFTIIVAYFLFFDTNTNSADITSSLSTATAATTTSILPAFAKSPSAQKALNLKGHKGLSDLLRPKVLSDLKPKDSTNLQRLMNRQQSFKMDTKNKLNHFLPHKLNPLQALTGPLQLGGDSDGSTKEIHFTLEAHHLPQAKGRKSSIFIRQAYPLQNEMNHDFVLIFLHGAAYSSATWSELGILSELARQGYISYALDIPGFGDSVNTVTKDNEWLREIISQLIGHNDQTGKVIESAGGVRTDNKKVVLVTASMSGKFAVPLLFERNKWMIGMITVAPVGTEKFKKSDYQKVQMPVCIIYGEEDKNLGEVSKENLVNIPNHKLIMVPGGKHAAYVTDPKFFHQQVVKWLTEFFD